MTETEIADHRHDWKVVDASEVDYGVERPALFELALQSGIDDYSQI